MAGAERTVDRHETEAPGATGHQTTQVEEVTVRQTEDGEWPATSTGSEHKHRTGGRHQQSQNIHIGLVGVCQQNKAYHNSTHTLFIYPNPKKLKTSVNVHEYKALLNK